jgi:hypothetical protein
MTFRCHHSASAGNMHLRVALLAGMLAGCKAEHPPDLCKGFSPHCEVNIAVACYTVSDCDQCGYYPKISHMDCEADGIADHGTAWVCRVGLVSGHAASFCVDASLTPCAPRLPGDSWCDGMGHTVSCRETTDGPLVTTSIMCYGCECTPGPRPAGVGQRDGG